MNVIIIEDELLAQERLTQLIKSYDNNIHITAALESVEETIAWLTTKPHPDLMFMDIHLADGHSFDILKKVNIQKPIIFTTAYDNYAIEAFQHCSIDYILKPVSPKAIANALQKYQLMRHQFTKPNYESLLNTAAATIEGNYKNRFLAKVGQRLFFVSTNDICFFAADNKTVFIVDKNANRYIINNTIEKLEAQLDPKDFFRINRKIIVRAESIEQIKPYHNNRLQLFLRGIKPTEELIISRERVTDFKQWVEA